MKYYASLLLHLLRLFLINRFLVKLLQYLYATKRQLINLNFLLRNYEKIFENLKILNTFAFKKF